ncbi:cytochrome P450 [Actinoplanes sp. N902-109]|uniref:cytochrome P450 n=1 Tax=Actinoplanes sp. (strain N902-109) TaxID=649831 RepID=UPI0003294399|nr:cytochrome P450 [Actinoplanes sp. N902-109]AGL16723.1 cytochrome P450 family protein [Actinoplanes sp. N902-109]
MTAVARTAVPPGPTGPALLGVLWKLGRDRLGLMSSAASYGDAVRLAPGRRGLFFFNHPDHAKHVLADNSDNYHKGIGLAQARRALGDGLLTSEGQLWRDQRAVIKPVFRPRRVAEQAPAVAAEAMLLVERLRAYAGRGPVDVVPELTALTLGVLGRTLLEVDLGGFTSLGHSFEAMQDQAMFEMASLGTVPHALPLPRQRRFRRARRDLDAVVGRLVVDRRARGGFRDGDDALSRLIRSYDELPDRELGRRRIRDELVTLLLAGHETTASTLGWTLHLLDRHPEARERVAAEAREVLGDRTPEHDDLGRLTYTSMVVAEAMRLFPPVWMLSRKAQAADVIGGYRVPAGADVLICPYTLHRHPALWPDPDRFDPQRFAPEARGRLSRYAYLPFGAGPRFCVGNQLGLMEAVFVVAAICRDLRLTTRPGHRVVPEPMLSLRLRGGLPMLVEPAR